MMTEPFPHADPIDQIELNIPVNDVDDVDASTDLLIPIEADPTDYHEQHRTIAPSIDDREPLRPSLSGPSVLQDRAAIAVGPSFRSNALGRNKLLLVTNIYPAGHQIRIEDHGTQESPDMQQPGAAALDVGERVLFVYTMTADEADATNSTVATRIYTGTDCRNLGKQIYNGHLMLTKPLLTIGDALDSPQAMLRIPLQRAGTIPLRIFTRRTIENISGPNEINILLPEEFTRTTR